MYRNTRCPLRESYGYHNTSGDLISPGDNRDSDAELWVESSSVSIPENSNLNSRRVNLSSTLYHRMMAKKLMLNKQAAFNQSGDSNLVNIAYNLIYYYILHIAMIIYLLIYIYIYIYRKTNYLTIV